MALLTIDGALPSLNQVTWKNRAHWSTGYKYKRGIEMSIAGHIWAQNIPQFKCQAYIKIKWIEKNQRRDRDNVQSATKFILDALVKTERIVNDNRYWLQQLDNATIVVDKERPRIEVWISDAWIS